MKIFYRNVSIKQDEVVHQKLQVPKYNLWVLLICIIICTGNNHLNAEDTLTTYVFQEESFDSVNLQKYMLVLVDTSGNIDMSQILAKKTKPFAKNLPNKINGETIYIWGQFKIKNKSGKIKRDYFTFCGGTTIDSVWLYQIADSSFHLNTISGDLVEYKHKALPIGSNLIPLILANGETKHFYIRIKYDENDDLNHFNHLSLVDQRGTIFQSFSLVGFQSFFAGVLLLFSLIGVFMAIAFKDRVFIYFGMLILFYAYFFSITNGILYVFLQKLPLYFDKVDLVFSATSGVVLFTFLFIAQYVNLKISLRKWYNIFMGISLLIVIFPFAFGPIFKSQTLNYLLVLLLIWAFVTLIPLFLMVIKGSREAKVLLWSMSLLILGGVLLTLASLQVLPNNAFTENAMSAGVFAFSSTLFFGLFEKISNIQKEKLSSQFEKEKSDELLFKVLPASIAQELKDTGVSKANSVAQISVLFTDFESFTEKATSMSAEDLVFEIDHCFRKFDNICEKYNVEKIKTIGDAYMAAGGLPDPSEDAVKNTILAALEMQTFITQRKADMETSEKECFIMRAGIHTGPVVAGIVGVKKFQYDIWGDTVNIASRMESGGETGKVNISQATYELIKDDPQFVFESRGKIDVKGKGEMEMYFVTLS